MARLGAFGEFAFGQETETVIPEPPAPTPAEEFAGIMIYVLRLGVHDGVSERTLYIGTDGYQSLPTDAPSNQFFMDRVKVAGSVSRNMFSGDGGSSTGGKSTVGYGNITVVNGRPYGGSELIDDWIDLAFRTVQIESLVDAFTPLVQSKVRLIASIEQLVSTKALDEFDLGIHDRLSDLDRPLLVNTYLGTTTSGGQGTAEGNADLTDKVKQKCWGTVHNVPCVNVNAFDLVWQVSDGEVDSIVLYDGAYALDNDGDVTDLSALLAATVPAGHYVTCLTLGLARPGSTPQAAVTADVGEGGADRSAGQIVTRMIEWFGEMYPNFTVELDAAEVTALDALNDSECGILVQDTETALDAIMRVLNSIGGWILPQSDSASVMNVGRFGEPDGTIVATYDLDDNIGGSPERVETGDEGRGVPAYKIIVKYDQVGLVQKGSDIFAGVDDLDPSRRGYLGLEWRSAQAQTSDLLTQYPNAPVITRETRLINVDDAQDEADRLLALYSVRRDIYKMKRPMANDPADDPEIGDVVELISSDGRMGLGTVAGSGKRFLVIGIDDDFSDTPSRTMTIWG